MWLSERFQWFAFNHHKGWTVLFTVATVGVVLLAMLSWLVVALILVTGWRQGHGQRVKTLGWVDATRNIDPQLAWNRLHYIL